MIKLFKHQEAALSYLRLNDHFALFMEQGTGKTLVMLFRILDLLKSGCAENALVVAPKSALGAWERDIEKFDPLDKDLLQECITLINYDKFSRGSADAYNHPWDIIILDESHNIKNHASNRSTSLLKLSCKCNYRYIMTGTPISNGQMENIWSQYTFLDPYLERGRVYSYIFGGSYTAFTDKYCIMNMYHKPTAYIRMNELQDIINEYSFRVKKSECLDLPEKLPDEVIKVDLAEKKLYKKLLTESALLQYEVLASNPLSRQIKLRQMCSGFLETKEGTKELKCEKLQTLKEIIENQCDDKKLVIFAEFKHSIHGISKLLSKMKIKYVVLDGDQKDKTIWRKFQEDKKIRIIVCQYQTANSGIDLYASDTIIYFEPTIRSIILEQSRDRIHRSGQTNKCSYIHLLTRGTVEVDIYRVLKGYGDFSEKLFIEYMDRYQRSYSTEGE